MLGADSPITPDLVERFLALAAMPKPMLGLDGAPAGAASGGGGGKKGAKGGGAGGAGDPRGAEALLATADSELNSHLVAILGKRGVDALVLPHAQRLCVGLLSAETCAFVWDLCLLAGWHQLQPVLTALLICVKEGLVSCTDTKSAIAYVQQSAAKVTPAQLQRVLEDHFMGAIREELQAPQPSAALD
eukprot:4194084-Prymnesium_polylepis.1